ncbi:MAG TPA: hypothetical protein VL282_15075 [Tepidisphaeraceae bacterium]|nr:hypothetical protein [Tepidisphaeraceae bacterium]
MPSGLCSQRTLDAWSRVNTKGQTQANISYQSAVHLSVGGKCAAPRTISWDTYDIRPGSNWKARYPRGLDWYHVGFAGASRPTSLFTPNSLTPWLIIIPYWSIAALFAVVPGYWLSKNSAVSIDADISGASNADMTCARRRIDVPNVEQQSRLSKRCARVVNAS